MIKTSPEIWHRDDFSLLCNWRKLFTAVEVGVDRGEFSQEFLAYWKGHNFLGVDNYAPMGEIPWDRNGDYRMALVRYERHAKRCRLLNGDSRDITKQILNAELGFLERKSFDFVYIDAAHDYENVKLDLEAWWPIVSSIGILAGHDFDSKHPGVMRAVSEFAVKHHLTVYLTKDSPESWYVYKKGIPGPDWRRST